MKEKNICSFYPFSNIGAGYPEGIIGVIQLENNIRLGLRTAPVLEPSPIYSSSACLLTQFKQLYLDSASPPTCALPLPFLNTGVVPYEAAAGS